jgi:probable phosphoglycerate mutase
MSRTLILVRHAESTANVDGSLNCAIPGIPLSPRGREQAAALARTWAWDGTAPVALWSSPMLRARQTADVLAERLDLPVRVHDAAHEALIGDLHGSTDPAHARLVASTFAAWRTDLGGRVPGGESGAEVVDRLRTVVADVLAALPPDGTAILVGHGTLFVVGVPRLATGLSPHVPELPNAGRAVLTDGTDGLRVRSWTGVLG